MAEIAATRAEISAGDTAFAGATSPRERMLVAFVRALDSERIPHCVLRGHRNFPRLAQGSDVAKEVSARIEELKKLAAGMVEHIVMLIAVFLVQTLVLPLVLLTALLKTARRLAA